jgi:hypothetical protein
MNKTNSNDSDKNCIIDNNKVILFTPPCKPSAKTKYFITTTTNEPLMPVRFTYAVNPHKIVGHFCSMGCIQRSKEHYVLLYKEEAQSICLGISADEVRPEHYPVIIGRAKVDYKQRTMIFDTDSFQRAINLVNFIDYYIPKKAAILKSVATYNRFIFANSASNIKFIEYENYNNIFTQANIELMHFKINNVSIDLLEHQEKQRKLSDYPIVEQFPAWDAEDGIDNLENILQIKMAIARSISEGVNCSMWEFYRYVASQGN